VILVLDSSAIVAWMMPDECWTDLDQIMMDYDQLSAPSLLWVELHNVFLINERRGRLPLGSAEKAMTRFEAVGVIYDQTPSSADSLMLARRHELTFYDALYLESALRLGAALASRDMRLIKAAKAEGITTYA
jgi:predicted nucleic acid-binding protein